MICPAGMKREGRATDDAQLWVLGWLNQVCRDHMGREAWELVPTVESNANIIAAIFSLSGFALAAVSGLIAGNPAGEVVLRSIIAMIACKFVGSGAAACITHVLEEHVKTYKEARPIPKVESDSPPQEVGERST